MADRKSSQTGIARKGVLIQRTHNHSGQSFLRLAGKAEGSANLSVRRDFARQPLR
jgi:hypothetical protein